MLSGESRRFSDDRSIRQRGLHVLLESGLIHFSHKIGLEGSKIRRTWDSADLAGGDGRS